MKTNHVEMQKEEHKFTSAKVLQKKKKIKKPKKASPSPVRRTP